MNYLKADKRHLNMGLDNKPCQNPAYWCKAHQVWLSEEDVLRKHCLCKPEFDMIGVHRCWNLVKREMR